MKIIGHRGARGLAPENTLASIQKALDHQVDAVEFDLRVTKDSVVILHHDAELTDPNDEKHLIKETDFITLKEHKPDLATFDEAIKLIGKKAIVYPEIKPGEPVEPIVKLIKHHFGGNGPKDAIRVMSFSQPILLELKEKLSGIHLTVLEKWSGVRATNRARTLGTKHIIMNQRWLWWGFIEHMSNAGYRLGAYTLNDPKKAKRWQKHGLKAVVTDFPDLFEN
jgi:glycerophosphoryl diester phosphodiesterase